MNISIVNDGYLSTFAFNMEDKRVVRTFFGEQQWI